MSLSIEGKCVLITAGPTYESIDPVRFIGNHSSGKMGYAIAKAFADHSAEVILISGPTQLTIQHDHIKVVHITTAEEMYQQCMLFFPNADITILAAAVSDYRPAYRSDQKIKKTSDRLTLELIKTKDIALEIGQLKEKHQTIIGFALETENQLENAKEKLINKNFDFIVLNSPNGTNTGFGHDTNQVTIIDKNNNIHNFELKSKLQVAIDILHVLLQTVHI